MGDHDRGSPSGHGKKAPEHVGLGLRIQGGGRFVEDDEVGVPHEAPGNRNPLPLPA